MTEEGGPQSGTLVVSRISAHSLLDCGKDCIYKRWKIFGGFRQRLHMQNIDNDDGGFAHFARMAAAEEFRVATVNMKKLWMYLTRRMGF